MGGIELLSSCGGHSGRHDETLAVRADFQWGLNVDLQQVEDRPVDHQRQAVPMFGQLFYHGHLRNSNVTTTV